MGFFPSIWVVWLYTALFALLTVLGLAGAFKSTRPRTKGIWSGCCLFALLALASAYLTGFTFHLNTPAPVSSDRLVYLVPQCVFFCVPDSNVQTEIVAVRVRDGQVQWRHPIRRSGLGPNDTFINDDQHVYLEQYALDASHPREDVFTALDAHSGHQVWQVVSDVGWTMVGAADGRLTLENQQTILILDAGTGKELLRLPIRNDTFERGGIVYTCSGLDNDITITATAEATGRTLWTSPQVFGCGLTFTPEVLLVAGNGTLTAIRITDGSLVWQVHEGGFTSGLFIDGNTLFTSVPMMPYENGKGMVNARNVSDGSLLWQKSMSNYPVLYGVADGVALEADTANTTALVALRGSDGKQLWSFPQANGTPFVRVITDGVVILGQSSSREIMALNLRTGAFYWQTSL